MPYILSACQLGCLLASQVFNDVIVQAVNWFNNRAQKKVTFGEFKSNCLMSNEGNKLPQRWKPASELESVIMTLEESRCNLNYISTYFLQKNKTQEKPVDFHLSSMVAGSNAERNASMVSFHYGQLDVDKH